MNSNKTNRIFQNLFVLEAANNHCGILEKGLQLIQQHGEIVRHHNVKAAIKLQFRDAVNFVHPNYKGARGRGQKALHYIEKIEQKTLSEDELGILVDKIKSMGCIPMSTPFDERSVDMCVEFGMPIIKIASSDVNDWPLIEKIASTRKPVIVSTGGADEKGIDDLVTFFSKRDIPLCINHCVSLYPTENCSLHLDQIDYLKNRFESNVIGFSTHEYSDWHSSMLISYGKGARSWERHIDVEWENQEIQPYCSLPNQIDKWFSAFKTAAEMCGGITSQRRAITKNETNYLDALVRGIYARQNIPSGTIITHRNFDDLFYLAIPLMKGQLSCREIFSGEKILKDITVDEPITIDQVNGIYSTDKVLREKIMMRGL